VIFRAGDKIIISNQATPDGAGQMQRLVVDTASYNSGTATWTLTTTTQVALDYSALDTFVGINRGVRRLGARPG
jgi:hypothetical protein